jgi:fermentation-respiration switch protein FrsA (DUF1100 family)
MMKAAVASVVLLVAIAALVRLAESRLAFFPIPGETATPQHFGVRHVASTISTRDGEQLRAWLLVPSAANEKQDDTGRNGVPGPRGHVVYFHGNGGNLSMWAPVLAAVAKQGYSVFAFDYRGYGDSTGRPSERGLYRDVDAVLEHFWRASPRKEPVLYWGRSLGGAMAAYAASMRAPDGLILESAFPDVRALFRASPPMAFLAFFSSYRFPAADFVQRVGRPTLVIHGDADSVIPFEQGKALFDRIPGPKSFVTIPGGDHNDAGPRDPRRYWEAVNSFAAGL